MLQNIRTEEWFDLAMYVNRNSATDTIMTVVSGNGDAQLSYLKESKIYYYLPRHGNPLQIPAQFHSSESKKIPITTDQLIDATAGTDYPDSLYRLIDSASNRNFDFPDMIVTLKNGYFLQNALGGFTKMYRTHGNLSRDSSSGILVSNRKNLPAEIRTKDILSLLGFDTKELFGDTYKNHMASGRDAIAESAKNRKLIKTDARDFSDTRVFRHLSRFISDTRPYFLVNEMQDFQKAFKSNPMQDPSGQGLSALNFDISKFDMAKIITTDDLGQLTDAVLTSGSPEKLMNDSRIQALQEKIQTISNWKAPAEKSETRAGFMESIAEYVLPTKRSVMKLYQIPHLLQNSLVIQEKQQLPDPRDLGFGTFWLRDRKRQILSSPQLKNSEKLFAQIFKEAELEDKVYPTSLSKIYNRQLGPVTIVYVPGIYNAIFDQEIFSLGIQALKDDLGLRVLQPPVESTCSSEYNAGIIRNYLEEDARARTARSQPPARYLFLSYSKGAVDTLHFFLSMPSFVSDRVIGMVSIAAPLQGSSILNKSDMPFEVVNALSAKKGPDVCKKEHAAQKSITPAAMNSFWRKNTRQLMGLTRYYSISFVSTPEDSHLFMRATKLIAQFDEDNDGVVPLSASKFPHALRAVDFGIVQADHLAGILSSRFNQKAFMKAVISAAGEMDAADWHNNFKWNSKIILDEYNTDKYFWNKKDLRGLLYANTFDLNRQLLPYIPDPADSYEPKIKLPISAFRFDPYSVMDVQKMPDILAVSRVTPAAPAQLPQGINIDFHHQNMVHFRLDHQFNYESRSPVGLDDNQKFGYAPAKFNGEDGWMRMRSENNSMRMTTLAYRFKPTDFSKMALKLAVTEEVPGADPVIGKTGKDDSAFQVWFSVRMGLANDDRAVIDAKKDRIVLFGYYWGSKVPGEERRAGDIYENWYSNKNLMVATLPEAKQLLLNNPDMLGTAQNYQRNFRDDLKKAFPKDNVDDMEVISITFQHDSNDTGTASDAYLKFLKFEP